MPRRALTPLLLVASLLFGLWASAQHAPEHAGTAAHHEICVICAFAHGNSAGPANSLAQLDLKAPALAFQPIDNTAVPAGYRAPSRARGPPAVLA
ncbi:MAG: DUF2946 family protein [Panacagrimonas sp.]